MSFETRVEISQEKCEWEQKDEEGIAGRGNYMCEGTGLLKNITFSGNWNSFTRVEAQN